MFACAEPSALVNIMFSANDTVKGGVRLLSSSKNTSLTIHQTARLEGIEGLSQKQAARRRASRDASCPTAARRCSPSRTTT